MKGVLIGECSWRMGGKGLSIGYERNDENLKRMVVDTHYRIAFQ